jgi:ParB-like chromosome segregation protein Spo0J
MKIEKIAISKLVKDPANVRRHGQKNLDAIKGSLLKFGQQKPIVIDDKSIVIAGNGTLEAAISLGWTDIDCVRTTLKGTDKAAFGVADNRTSELAEWDDDALGSMLQAMREDGLDLKEIGFDLDDIARFEISEDANGKEFDESCADKVDFLECPKCNHRWPK